MLLNFEKFNEGLNVKGKPEYVLNADFLHYSPDTKTFSTEVSDLGRSFNPLYRGGDEIIIIHNTKTGKECEYYKSGSKRDGEGELMYDIFKAKPNSIGAGTQLLIFND